MKDRSPKLDKLFSIGKSTAFFSSRLLLKLLRFIIKLIKGGLAWWKKPHVIRIKKKTIIIGVFIVFLAYQAFWPKAQRIVYAGPPTTPVHVKNPFGEIPKKIAELPQTHFEAVQTLEPVQTAPTPSPTSNAQSSTDNLGNSVVPGCGDNAQANFIYMHESGCNLNAVNSIGCRGIGQACPGSKLPCGADYACQNNFFTAYANATYGGWAGAYAFWLAHSWW